MKKLIVAGMIAVLCSTGSALAGEEMKEHHTADQGMMHHPCVKEHAMEGQEMKEHPCMKEHAMGPGMMMGPGMTGFSSEENYQKFLNETKDLRKTLLNKKFDYYEEIRGSERDDEAVRKIETEILEIQKKLAEKAKELQ